MKAPINSIFAALAGGLVFALATIAAGEAAAGGCGCVTIVPPTNTYGCCQPPSTVVNVPGVTVEVAPSIIVNANVQAQASVIAGAGAGGAVYVGGGGYAGYSGPGTPGLVQNLNVDNGGVKRSAYEATRTKIIKVVIEAVCLDDKDVPHPASQVTPDRDIDDAYDGELYRCIAGTRLQATIADYNGQIAFDHGWTLACDKGQALYHHPGGKVECVVQKPARDCNERSLLRRFGAGVKILTMLTVEKYTAYREETIQSSSASSMSLDGGVGGVMY